MQDFKPRRPRRSPEDTEEHPIAKLVRHVLMHLMSSGLFIYTLITHDQNDFGFRACFGAAALVMWMVVHTTQKMPARLFIRATALLLLLGAIGITWIAG